VDFREADLPVGVTIDLLKAAFRELKQAGRIAGGIVISDNARPSMQPKCLDWPQTSPSLLVRLSPIGSKGRRGHPRTALQLDV